MTDEPVAGRSAERLILLLVGAVGAGKGTQATILSRELGLVHLASGNLFRAALAKGTRARRGGTRVHGGAGSSCPTS